MQRDNGRLGDSRLQCGNAKPAQLAASAESATRRILRVGKVSSRASLASNDDEVGTRTNHLTL